MMSGPFSNRRRMLTLFALGGILMLYVVPTQIRPANFMQDDSYFYLQIASNILDGHGSTFHRVTPTNGYHPLWLGLSVLSMAVAGGNKQLGLHITFIIQILLSLATILFVKKISKAISLKYWLLGLSVIVAFLLGTGVYGSEAHVNAAALTTSIYFFILALSEDQYWNWAVAGLFLGLAVLARLDNVFIVMTLTGCGALANLNKNGWTGIIRRLLLLGFSFAIVLVPYLVYNQTVYGHLMPISGSIKGTFPRLVIDLSNLGRVGTLSTIFGLLSIVVGLLSEAALLRRVLLIGLGAGVLLHAAYVVLFTDHYTFWPWYYVSGVITAGLVISHSYEVAANWVEHFISRQSMRQFINLIATISSILLIVAGGARAWSKAEIIGSLPNALRVNEYRWPDEFAIWMRDHLPADSLVFAYDWPGAIAYYSNQRILPMDGLMNDFHYDEELITSGAQDYLCSHAVKYYLGPFEEDNRGNQELEIPAPLSREPAGKLVLADQYLIVQVRDVVADPERTPPYAVWALDNYCLE